MEKKLTKSSILKEYPYIEDQYDERWIFKKIEIGDIEGLLKYIFEIVIRFGYDHPCLFSVQGFFVKNAKDRYELKMKLPMIMRSLKREFDQKREKNEKYKEEELVKYMYTIVCGLNYLHSKKIFHSEIKIDNIVIDISGKAQLLNVGCSGYIPEDDYSSQATHASDSSWNLGITILELLHLERKLLVSFKTSEEIKQELGRLQTKSEAQEYSKPLLDLIFGLLRVDSEKRLKVRDLKIQLEEGFKEILTEEFKASLGLLKEDNTHKHQLIADVLKKYQLEVPKVASDEINKSSRFSVDLTELQGKLSDVISDLERIKSINIQEREEMSKKLEELLKTRIEEKEKFLEQKEELGKKIQDLEEALKKQENSENQGKETSESTEKLENFKSKMRTKWQAWFDIEGDRNCLSVSRRKNEITNEILEEWINYFVKNLEEENFSKGLIQLRVRLDNSTCISAEGMKRLGLFIGSQFKYLQRLEIYLIDCPSITDSEVRMFIKEIGANLKGLRHLVLILRNTRVGDDAVNILAEQIGLNLQSLQSLDLMLSGTQTTDYGVQKLAEQIGNNLKSLQHLELGLSDCKKITDIGVESLSKHLRDKLINLQHFELYLSGTNTTDKGMISLSENIIANLINLRNLELRFNSTSITDEGVHILGERIGTNLKNLQSFQLFLSETAISDLGAKALGQQIGANLKNLQNLYWDFAKCEKVTAKIKKSLEDELEKSIEKVSVH